jgi:ABC-type dipeptide/oligopeptide/nickel transport system permease component
LLPGVVSLVLLFTFAFFTIRILPGDPALLLAGPTASAESVQQLRHLLGLDRPLWEQYLLFWDQVIRGDFGSSAVSGRPVVSEIARRFPATVQLGLAGMALATVLGVAGGLVAAVRRNGLLDAVISSTAVALTSLPAFWFALLLVSLFAIRMGVLPSSGTGSPLHLVLPAVVLAATQIGMVLRVTRSSLLEVSQADYVRTARAKGLHPARIWMLHILRNALVPTVTVVGLQLGLVLGGAVITETVFNWPGVGKMLVDAVLNRDYPIIQGLILLFGVIFIVVNLLVDFANALIDPRLRTQSR